jgi:cell division inhibitor SepF
MASFMDRALAYLGLKDVEDDELYDDYAFEDDHEAPAPAPAPRARTVYPERDHPRELGSAGSEQGASGTVRPLAREDASGGANPRPAVVRPLVPSRNVRPRVVAPARFADAQEIGDLIKQSSPVIVNLQVSDRDLSRRMIDFCSGLTYALGGTMEKVADQVFLLTPSNVEVSPEERQRLQERGLFEP